MICFDNVTKHYSSAQDPGSAALSNVSFFLQSGTFNFITGHSGAGKSTLLRLLAGLDRPSSGDIIVEDQALQTLNDAQLTGVRECMGIVFQDNQLLQDRSVFDNVALPLIISKRGKREIVDRVSAALERVALTHKADARPHTLSGGEQQRVGIARAVVNRPRLLIADEPTGNLDPQMSLDIIRLFRRFNSAGVTVLIATHDISLLETRHHNRLTLSNGHLSVDGNERPRMMPPASHTEHAVTHRPHRSRHPA